MKNSIAPSLRENMTSNFAVELEIRCAYARGLVLAQIHGIKSDISQDALLDVRESLLDLGESNYFAGLEQVPTMLADVPCLVAVWEDGYRTGKYSTSCDERM
jgi:hypothetical protein